MSRLLDKNQTIGSLVLTKRVTEIEQVLSATSNASQLLSAVKSKNQTAIASFLETAFFNNSEGSLDALYFSSADTGDIFSATTGAYDLTPLETHFIEESLQVSHPQTFILNGNTPPLVILVTSVHVVDQDKGRLLGTLLAGVVLTDNQSFIREIQNANQANSVGLYYGPLLIAQTTNYRLLPPKTAAKSFSQYSVNLSAADQDPTPTKQLVFSYPLELGLGNKDRLVMQTSNPPGAIGALQESMKVDFLILFSVLATIFLFMAALLHRFTRRSLNNVTHYAKQVLAGKEVTFVPTAVEEFNQLGKDVHELYTAWQDSELLSQQVLNNAPSIIFIKAPDGRHLFVNKHYEELFERKAEDVLGKKDTDLHDAETSAAFRKDDLAVMAEGIPVQMEELVPINGQTRAFLTIKFPVFTKDRDLIGVCGISTDISERKLDEIALHTAKENADLANRAKTEFLANMSHELRTPLNAIIGFSDIINNELFGKISPERYGDYCQEIQKSGHHLLQIISDILDVSKIEIGESELDEKISDADTLVQSSLALLKERAFQGKVILTADLPTDLPQVRVDRRRMKQILINLLSNSVKFTPEGGEVKISVFLDQNDAFNFVISDTGIGIEKIHLDQIFDPFVQGENSYAKQFEGTGLGLTLVKQLTEQHGGTITLNSEVMKGTVVHITLPAERTYRDKVAIGAANA